MYGLSNGMNTNDLEWLVG